MASHGLKPEILLSVDGRQGWGGLLHLRPDKSTFTTLEHESLEKWREPLGEYPTASYCHEGVDTASAEWGRKDTDICDNHEHLAGTFPKSQVEQKLNRLGDTQAKQQNGGRMQVVSITTRTLKSHTEFSSSTTLHGGVDRPSSAT